MKIIITESQYKTLINEQKVYTSKTSYNKAMVAYTKIKSLYDFSLDVKKYWGKHKYDDYKKISEYIKSHPYSKKFYNFVVEKMPGWVSIGLLSGFEVCAENRPVGKEILNAIGSPKIIKWHKVDFGGEVFTQTQYFNFFYLPEVKKPIKPILQLPTPTPIIKTTPTIKSEPSKTTPTIKSEPIKTKEFTAGYNDSPVYGPSLSLIGFMRERDFIPATGKYTTGMNNADKDLLNNKVELNKYIQNKFGQYANPIQ
jgi:hypothetical protein